MRCFDQFADSVEIQLHAPVPLRLPDVCQAFKTTANAAINHHIAGANNDAGQYRLVNFAIQLNFLRDRRFSIAAAIFACCSSLSALAKSTSTSTVDSSEARSSMNCCSTAGRTSKRPFSAITRIKFWPCSSSRSPQTAMNVLDSVSPAQPRQTAVQKSVHCRLYKRQRNLPALYALVLNSKVKSCFGVGRATVTNSDISPSPPYSSATSLSTMSLLTLHPRNVR